MLRQVAQALVNEACARHIGWHMPHGTPNGIHGTTVPPPGLVAAHDGTPPASRQVVLEVHRQLPGPQNGQQQRSVARELSGTADELRTRTEEIQASYLTTRPGTRDR
jgi:hypothetical protein